MKNQSKKIIAVTIVLLVTIILSACRPAYPSPEPPHEEPMMKEEHNQEPMPEPPQGDKSNNPNERKGVEGYVKSVNNDKVVIKQNSGGKFTLRLSENTEWGPGIESWDILPGNYIIVRVALEGRTQGEVVYIMENINAE